MNKMKAFISAAVFLVITGCGLSKRNTGHLDCKGSLTEADSITITSPPISFGFNSFYKKYVDANGIPVIGSYRVPDRAFWSARKIIVFLTESLPENVRKSLTDHGTRVGIMARYEGTTNIPEHAHLAADTTCAEENLLCYQLDKYHAEDILIHEFAHTIHGVGILPVDSTFNDRLKATMDKALADGKWKNTYAATNIWEYWAEGVQDWFNVNGEVEITDGKHNQVNLRKELKEYDPGLYSILSEYFPETDECISCHSSTVNLYSVDQ
jgi:alpha-glucosidase